MTTESGEHFVIIAHGSYRWIRAAKLTAQEAGDLVTKELSMRPGKHTKGREFIIARVTQVSKRGDE